MGSEGIVSECTSGPEVEIFLLISCPIHPLCMLSQKPTRFYSAGLVSSDGSSVNKGKAHGWLCDSPL